MLGRSIRLCRVVVLVSLLRIHPDTKFFEVQAWFHDLLRKSAEQLFELDEVKVNRIFLAGANPFALSTRQPLEIAGLVHERFPQTRSVGCFTRVTEAAMKSDEELTELTQAGFDGRIIGIESGYDEALAFMDKGYETVDIVERYRRLDAVSISYAFFYLAGIASKGRGIESAQATAAVCNQTNPWLIGTNMLTVYRSSELYREIDAGRWIEAGEVEKHEEIRELLLDLEIPTEFAMLGASNPVMICGRLPEQREEIVGAIEVVVRDVGEERLRAYRAGLNRL